MMARIDKSMSKSGERKRFENNVSTFEKAGNERLKECIS